MKIVTVIPLSRGVFKDNLTYFTAKDIALGDVVVVPIRNKKTLALTTKIEDLTNSKSEVKDLSFGLKKILENKGKSFFNEEFLASVFEASMYFATNASTVFSTMIPNLIKENYDQFLKTIENKTDNKETELSNIKNEKLFLQNSVEDRISIYKTLIRSNFAKKKSVIVVLPTEYDIILFKETLSRGIENFTFEFHSGISDKKLTESIKNFLKTEHPVLVLCTPPFLSLPHKNIKTIILEHESSSAFKTLARPFLDMRTFVEIYASKMGSQFIVADTILRFETIGRKDRDLFGALAPMSYRHNFKGKIEIQKRNTKKDKKNWKIFSDKNIEELKISLTQKKKIFIFSLRKGLATYTICKDCADTVLCDVCASPVVLYLSKTGEKRMFVCNHCRTEKSPDTRCKNCNSWNLLPLGIGVDTVHQELKELFNEEKVQILKLDKESAKSKKEAEAIIKKFDDSKYAILVGTEIALFYLNEKIPTSFIASFDSFWSIPNYKISERILQLILNILAKTEDKLIIQTKNITDPLLQSLSSGVLTQYIRSELKDRKNLNYPPYARFIKIIYVGDKIKTTIARKFLHDTFANYEPEFFGATISKQKGKFVSNMLIKIKPEVWSTPAITPKSKIDPVLYKKLISLTPDFSIIVDPEDLL